MPDLDGYLNLTVTFFSILGPLTLTDANTGKVKLIGVVSFGDGW